MLGLASSLTVPYTRVFWDYYAMQFDGTDEAIEYDAAATQFDKDVGTVSAWVTVPTTTTTRMVFGVRVDSNNFIQMFYHAGTNQFRATYKGGGSSKALSTSSPAMENSGQVHHVAMTWDTTADEVKLWVDGIERDDASNLPTISGTFSTFYIGQKANNTGYWSGTINDFAVWDSVQDVSRIYNSSHGSVTNGRPNDETQHKPKIYLTFEEGGGETVKDTGTYGRGASMENTPEYIKDTITNPSTE